MKYLFRILYLLWLTVFILITSIVILSFAAFVVVFYSIVLISSPIQFIILGDVELFNNLNFCPDGTFDKLLNVSDFLKERCYK